MFNILQLSPISISELSSVRSPQGENFPIPFICRLSVRSAIKQGYVYPTLLVDFGCKPELLYDGF